MPTVDFKIMGILNVTPDSFSDGGQFNQIDAALIQARRLLNEGADYIDIGGESTRPGADSISIDEELSRVMPVIETLRQHLPHARLSIDSKKAEVMRCAIQAGVHFVNDINALRDTKALQAVADSSVEICLMHMQGAPRHMQQQPQYTDVFKQVHDFLQQRIQACINAGINPQRLYIDPGFGFGKTLQHNLQLMRQLSSLKALDVPILIGVSRKSMIGTVLDKTTDNRLHGGIGLAVWAYQQGAKMIRTHDVAATHDALRMVQAVLEIDAS